MNLETTVFDVNTNASVDDSITSRSTIHPLRSVIESSKVKSKKGDPSAVTLTSHGFLHAICLYVFIIELSCLPVLLATLVGQGRFTS